MRIQYAFGPSRSLMGRRGKVRAISSDHINVVFDDGHDTELLASSIRELTPKEYIEMQNIESTNPKDAIGRAKVDLSLVPATAIVHEAHAFMDGAKKYGPYNWRSKNVSAMVYVAACLRHINQWVSGEGVASDSLCHHLGHARACLGIILDAQSVGMLVDDRPIAVNLTGIMNAIVEARKVVEDKQ